jgi:hypothetical protein
MKLAAFDESSLSCKPPKMRAFGLWREPPGWRGRSPSKGRRPNRADLALPKVSSH